MTRAAHLGHFRLLSRFFITLLVLTGWLVLSNHCALALFEEPQQSEAHPCHAEMPGVGSPAAGTAPGGKPIECCYSLDVAVPDAAKPSHPLADTFALLPLVWTLMINTPTDADADADADPFISTSPPERLLSFPELVLQRCLPSLAPPLV